jgi:hypothetical protein
MSLLSVVQDACRHSSLSLPVLTSVIGNTQSHAPALLMAAKEELDSLATRHNWQKLTKENTFTSTATAVQVTASAIPTDFDRMIPETFFNRTTRRAIFGPISADEWQRIEASLTTYVNPAFRFRGGTILITPDPTTAQTLAYEYVSTYKARSAAGAEQTTWAVDTDTSVFPEPIVTLGVVWRYRRGRGYPYNNEQEEYERRVVEAILRDGSKPRLYSDAPSREFRPRPPQVPETLTGL